MYCFKLIKIIPILQSRVIGVFLTIILFSFFQNSYSQVKVSRQGFPFCEPFNSTSYNADIIKGINSNPNNWARIANESLQLTDNVIGSYTIPNTTLTVQGKFGYVFLDIPFSSEYGVKASFEYFMYGGDIPPNEPADGFSFFLFDGSIDESDFRIGWPGGSLGYAQINVTDNSPVKSYPGLKGGYIGIGFDNYFNWGNYWQGKVGGFNDPPGFSLESEDNPVDSLRHYNSIAIRGPESEGYEFVTGKRVNDGPDSDPLTMNIDEDYYLYPDVLDLNKRFNLSSGDSRGENCNLPGYRKVFFDLSPDLSNPGYYRVSVSMLVNTASGGKRIEIIIDDEPYPYLAPETLKIGFAGSTGDGTNFHEIRNLAVDVAKTTVLEEAKAPDVDFEICQGEDKSIEKDLLENELTDPDAFIQCINLYVDGQDGFNYSNPSTWPSNVLKIDNHLEYDLAQGDCGLTPICTFCLESNQVKVTPLGTFTVDLDDLDLDDNTNNRKVKIQFTQNGQVGTQKVYYSILDNYGQISEPGIITAVVNPYPIEINRPSDEDILNPSCDGQSDGSLSNYIIGNLVDGFDYEWFYEGTSIGKAGASVGPLSNGQATFEVQGLNIGTYTLSVWNPSDNDPCEESFDIEIDVESGTPVELEPYANEICEGTDAVIAPTVDLQYNPNNLSVPFLWYTSSDRSVGSLITNATTVIDGANVTVKIDGSGQITISGLEADGLNPKDYTLYVETDFKNNSGNNAGNFCQINGVVATEAVITVYPALAITPTVVADWCREGAGEITVEALGGNGDKTFSLFDEDDNLIESQVNPSTATFSGFPGDYIIEIESSNPSCFATIPVTIEGPDEDLFNTPIAQTPATCGLDNGTFNFEIGGGNGPLGISNLSISGGPEEGVTFDLATNSFTYSGLAPGLAYTVTVSDTKGCVKMVDFTIEEIQTPVFSVSGPIEACEDQPSVNFEVTSDFFELQGTAVPVFNWFTQETGGTPITTGSGPGGMNYSINNTSGNLEISSLEVGTYTFWVEMSGPDACNIPRIKADFLVNPIPVVDFTKGDISCFGGNDGTLEVIATPLGSGPFNYELIRTSDNSVVQSKVNGNFIDLSAGEYLVRVTNTSTGCTYETQPDTLTEPTVLEIIDVVSTPTTCGVADSGQLKLTVTGGTAPYTFATISRNGNAYTGHMMAVSGTDYTFTGLQEGNYEIVFRDSQNCIVTATETVEIVPVPEIVLSANSPYCYGETFTIGAEIKEIGTLTSSVNYTWVVDGIVLTSPGGSLGKGTYIVTPGAGINPSSLTINNLEAGAYAIILEARGAGSCDLNFPIDISVNPIPDTDFEVVDAECFGGLGSITITSGAQAGYTYTLSNGDTNSTGQFPGLLAGEYTVTITNTFGCIQEVIRTISQPELLVLDPVDFTNPSCGEENGVISFKIIGGTKDYAITLNGVELNSTNFDLVGDSYTVEGLAPGKYSVKVTDAKACFVEKLDLFDLVNNDGFEVEVIPMEVQICESGIAKLIPQLTIPPGASPVYRWYLDFDTDKEIISSPTAAPDGNIYEISSNGTLNVTNLAVGSYKYYFRISGNNICDRISEATIKVIPPIEATVKATPVYCFEEANGIIEISQPTGGNGTYEYSINNVAWQSTTLFENLSAGSYTVFIRDNSSLNGCQLQIPDVLIEGPADPITENQGVELPVSCGLENGAVRDVLVTGGWGDYTFEWRKDDPTTGQLLTNGSLTGIEDLAQGNYFLTIKDSGGCIETFEFVIGISSDPVYELVDPIDACFGKSIEIRPVHLAPDPSLPPSAATEIRWYKEPNQVGLISEGPDSSDPSVIYSIDDSDWLNPLLEIENLPVGSHDYFFYVVCTGQEIQVDIIVFDTPAVVFETIPVSCFGDSDGDIVAISGTNSDYTYSINGANPISLTELEALNFAAGNYQIEVLTPAGCPQIIDTNVEGPTGPLEILLLSELDPSCNLENGEVRLKLNGGNPEYILTLKGVEVTGFDASVDGVEVLIENLSGGTHLFELTDSKNCSSATLSITLDPLEIPEFDATGAEICALDASTGQAITGVLKPVIKNLAGSSPIFTWFYKNASGVEVVVKDGDQVLGGIAQINPNGELELTGVTASDTSYKFLLEVTGPLVCPQPKIEVDFTVNFTPEVVLEKTDINCFGESTGEIRVQSGGAAGFTYTLNTGESNDSGLFANLPAGKYAIKISNGSVCTQTLQIEISQPDEFLISDIEYSDPTCDASNGEIVFEIGGGVPEYDILINSLPLTAANYSFISNSGRYTVQNLPPGTYSINVTDGNGCEIEGLDLFKLTDNPGVEIVSQQMVEEICEGQTAQVTPNLTLPAGISPILRWYKDAANTQQIISSPTPDADGIVYQINSQGVLSVANLPSGDYQYYLRISGPGICTKVTEAIVTVIGLPTVTLDVSNISCFGEKDGSVRVSTGHDPTFVYNLSNGQSNSTGEFINLNSGNYTLEVENTSGCIQVIDFEIEEPAAIIIKDPDFTNPTCDENNGEITFEITGGTGEYSILINGQELIDSNFDFIDSGQKYTVKGLSPGTYSIQITDENGCAEIAQDFFTLVNEAGVLIGSNPLFEEIMLGEIAILTPELSIPGGVKFDFSWYFDPAATQIITSDPDPASDGVTYQIDGNGKFTLSDLRPGTYKYYFEISGDGICVTVTEAVVVVKSPVTADIVSTPVTCFDGSDGTISVENIVGGNPPLSFSIDGVNWQPTPVFENLPVGTYTIFITDPTITSGFLASFPGILIETTAIEIITNTPDIIRSSCDQPNGAIQNLEITGGAGGYTFEWRKDDPISGELLPNGTLAGLEDLFPSTYFISVTDANGCQGVFSFEITQLPAPVYELVPPIDVCVGDLVIIKPVFLAPIPTEPTAPTEIEWYKEASQVGLITNGPDSDNTAIIYSIDETNWVNPQLTISNLPVGSHDFYFYVVCTGQEIKVDVNVFEVPEMVFDTTPITCFGDSNGKIVSLSGDLPEYTYSLNGAANISLAELQALNLGAGSYIIEVLTPAGCSQLIDVLIEGPSSVLSLDTLITIDPGCGADNGKIQGQITGGWAPYTVNLFKEGVLIDSFGQAETSLVIEDLSIGKYSLEIIDDKGCKIESDDLNLIDGPTQILVDNQEICEGSVVTLVATLDPPVSDFQIQWFFDEAGKQPINSSPNPGPGGIIYQISATGELTLTGLAYSDVPYQYFASAIGPDVCGGFVAKPTVQVNEIPAAIPIIAPEKCFGEGGTITINATGGNGGYEYSIDGTNFQKSNSFIVQQGTYTATVRTGEGCSLIIPDLFVTGPSAPIAIESLEQIDATCGKEDGSLFIVLTGGYGDFEVDLILNSTIIITEKTAADGSITFSNLAEGSYFIEVRDSGGCAVKLDNRVDILNIPTPISVEDISVCEGEAATLTPLVAANTPDLQFNWFFDAAGSNPINAGTSGGQTYSIAKDGSLTIEGLQAKGTSYEYFVLATGRDVCGTVPEKALVNVTGIPNLRVSNPSIVCDPQGTVDLTQFIEGFNPSIYDYNVLAPSGSPMRIDELTSVDLSGDYRVSSTVKGTSCWNQPQRILVIISESLLVAEFNYLVDFGNGNIFQNEDIPLGEDVYFNDISKGNAVIWNWDFGDGFSSTEQNPVHTYNEIGSYLIQLRVVDDIGCESLYERVINVLDDYDVIIPNAFTPNGSKNQFFKPEHRGIASMEFFIFNTWGELIYTTTSLEDKGWDGTLNGSEAPNGNYVYRGRFVSRGGVVIEKAGVFILIR